jgi:hypothetical protein
VRRWKACHAPGVPVPVVWPRCPGSPVTKLVIFAVATARHMFLPSLSTGQLGANRNGLFINPLLIIDCFVDTL